MIKCYLTLFGPLFTEHFLEQGIWGKFSTIEMKNNLVVNFKKQTLSLDCTVFLKVWSMSITSIICGILRNVNS